MPKATSSTPERLLLVDLSERERHELREQLVDAGYDVAIALNYADASLRLLTWRPHGIITDGDFAGAEVTKLANLIRHSAPAPVSVVFLCQQRPREDVPAIVLLRPVTFPDLLGTLRASLAALDDAPIGGGWTTPKDE